MPAFSVSLSQQIETAAQAFEHHASRATSAAPCDSVPRSALCVLFEELDGVADCQNGFGGIVGYLAAKFLLEGHDELDRVEAVGAEIVDETGVFRDLVGLDAEMLNDDLLNPLANITHRFQPLRSTRPDNNVSARPSLRSAKSW